MKYSGFFFWFWDVNTVHCRPSPPWWTSHSELLDYLNFAVTPLRRDSCQLAFSINRGTVTGFPLECIFCKPLIQHLFQLRWFGLFQCPLLEESLQTFTGCYEHSSLVVLLLYVEDLMLYEAIATCFHLLCLLIYSSFWGIINVTCFPVPAVPWLLVFGYFEAVVMAQCAQSSPDNTR